MKKNFLYLLLTLLLLSCGEEVLTTSPQTSSDTVATQVVSSFQNCSQSQLDKPPVDILYVLDNSGSSLSGDFQSIKTGIANTINTISTEFDFHVYISPLIAPSGSSISSYPLIVSDTGSLSSPGSLNIRSIDSLSVNDFFPTATGNNTEAGFSRAYNLVNSNRSNGIFRSKAHTIIVMVSNGDDTSAYQSINGNVVYNSETYSNNKNNLLSFKSSPLTAETLRFISVVPHTSACKTGYTRGSEYMKMSQDIYNTLSSDYQNDSSSNKDSKDLCSSDVSSIFTSINSTIKSVVTGHQYDHWLISNATDESQIQEDDITLTKVLSDGSQLNIPQSSTNGFEYLGYQVNKNTRYAPTVGDPVTGLVVKLNGSARVDYPECVVAQTKTPVEYYGWTTIPREPIVDSIVVKVNGVQIDKSNSNGWSYDGYFDSKNVKKSYNGASDQPGVYKSGYFIGLNGSAIISNGDSVEVFYTPAPIN